MASELSMRTREERLGEPMTRRERQIADLIADGLSGKEIGLRLSISHRTVECHSNVVLAKLGVPNRAAVARALARLEVPADVARLVLAARSVAFEGPFRELAAISPDAEDLAAIHELDAASEAFADRVPWDNDPADGSLA